MNILNFLFLLPLILSYVEGATEKLCYQCVSQSGDWTCLNYPDSDASFKRSCDKRYCTIFRQELVSQPGQVNSFRRGCDSDPTYVNKVVTDSTFKTYYRSCTSNLCNSGSGIAPISTGNTDWTTLKGPFYTVGKPCTSGNCPSPMLSNVNTSSITKTDLQQIKGPFTTYGLPDSGFVVKSQVVLFAVCFLVLAIFSL